MGSVRDPIQARREEEAWRPGYDYWVSFDGHGSLNDPTLNHNGK